MTKTETIDLVRLLLAAFPGQRSRMAPEDVKAMVAAYHVGLGDLDRGALEQAAARVVRTSKFLPSVAEIREAAVEIQGGNGSPTGAQAWGVVLRKIGRYGMNRAPGVDFTFDDPITAKLVTPATWREICNSENIASDRARFIDAYDQLAARARKDAQAAPGAMLPSGGSAGASALPAGAHELVQGVAKALGGGR